MVIRVVRVHAHAWMTKHATNTTSENQARELCYMYECVCVCVCVTIDSLVGVCEWGSGGRGGPVPQTDAPLRLAHIHTAKICCDLPEKGQSRQKRWVHLPYHLISNNRRTISLQNNQRLHTPVDSFPASMRIQLKVINYDDSCPRKLLFMLNQDWGTLHWPTQASYLSWMANR